MEVKTEQEPIAVTCETCKLNYEISLAADSRKYKDKYYCNTHWEDAIRKDEASIKCQRCNSEASASFMKTYHGKKICPRCFAIQQHDDIVNASKAYRKKIASMKKVTLTLIGKLPEIKKQRLTNKNWMDVAYKTPSKSKK